MKKANEKPPFAPEEIDVSPYDAAELLDSNELMAGYLARSLEDPDPDIFLEALGDVLRAKGIAHAAKMTGLAPEVLRRTCQPGKKPDFETIMKITRALGFPLSPSLAGENKGKAKPPLRRGKREALAVNLG
jgi:probable addiction module antidote protein